MFGLILGDKFGVNAVQGAQAWCSWVMSDEKFILIACYVGLETVHEVQENYGPAQTSHGTRMPTWKTAGVPRPTGTHSSQ